MAGIPGQPSARPADVNNPIPGNTQTSVFDQQAPQMAQAAGAAASSPSAQPQGSVFDQGPDASSPTPPPDNQPGMASQALDAAGRVLDYPGGLMRAGLASAASALTGNEVVTPADLKNAAVGKGPNTAEYLKRMGVSEGGSMTLPGLGRVTLRGAEGLALDVLSDPLTLIAKTAKTLPAVQALLEAPGKASEALGEAIYKSALTGKDAERVSKAGDALIQAGAPVGGQAALAQKIADTAQTMGKLRQGLYDQFASVGHGMIDMPSDMFKNSQGVISKLADNPTLKPLADEFSSMINQYQSRGFVPMDTMSQWKTSLYDSLPKSAFTGARLGSPGKMFKAALAQDFKNAIVDSGNKSAPGLGDAINEINDKWGALLEAKPSAPIMNGSLGHAIDAATLAAGGVPVLVKKKLAELALGPYGKTITGKALMAAGTTDVANRLVRQGAQNLNQPPQESALEGE